MRLIILLVMLALIVAAGMQPDPAVPESGASFSSIELTARQALGR